jgi:hypothetical protein
MAKKYMSQNYGNTFDIEPHITHLLLPLFENEFYKLQETLHKYLSNLKPFEIKIGGISISKKRKFFALEIHDPKLARFHAELLKLVEPYRKGAVREKDLKRLGDNFYNSKEVENIKKFGYPRVLKLNKPHITLGSCEHDQCNLNEIRNELEKILKNTINSKYKINNLVFMLHTNSEHQSDMVEIYKKTINLS